MFTITAIESIRIPHTVYRIWVQRLLTDIHPNRAQELAALSDRDLAAELAAPGGQRPAITAAFEALLAEASEFSRTSDFAIGIHGQEFVLHVRSAGTEAVMR